MSKKGNEFNNQTTNWWARVRREGGVVNQINIQQGTHTRVEADTIPGETRRIHRLKITLFPWRQPQQEGITLVDRKRNGKRFWIWMRPRDSSHEINKDNE